MSVPSGVTVEKVLVDGDGWTIFHTKDNRPYTKRLDTIRVGKYNNAGDYRVEMMRPGGWQHLIAGRIKGEDSIEWVTEGIENAVAVLYGEKSR